MSSPLTIDREQLAKAIIELNSMSRAEGVIMTRGGEIKVGNQSDTDCLGLLIAAPLLARQLTGDGLSCYTDKEIQKWARAYPLEGLEAILAALPQTAP